MHTLSCSFVKSTLLPGFLNYTRCGFLDFLVLLVQFYCCVSSCLKGQEGMRKLTFRVACEVFAAVTTASCSTVCSFFSVTGAAVKTDSPNPEKGGIGPVNLLAIWEPS